MSGKASAVLWLGLILITLNLISEWSTIKSVLFTGSPSSSGSSGSGSSSPGIDIPIDPFIPGIGNIKIPLSAGATPASGQTTNIQAV
jgi:hypothetical protein